MPDQKMSQLASDCAVTSEGGGMYRAVVSGSWNIGDNPNGGYLLALALSAVEAETGLTDALSVTAHYLRPGTPGGEAAIEVEVVRAGRTLTSIRAVVSQDGKERLLVTAALGTLDSSAINQAYTLAPTAPEIPGPGDCIDRLTLIQGVELSILSRLDVRIHPADAEADPTGAANMRGWIRLRDGAAPESHALVLFADAFPPAVFTRFGQVGWVPTIELTAHVRAAPAPGWIQAEFSVDDLTEGRLIESGTLWDSEGQVVLRSRQLGLMRLT